MIRRNHPESDCVAETRIDLQRWRGRLLSRRRFLLATAGGMAALSFAPPGVTSDEALQDPWPTLDAVLQHLLPSEVDSPGAKEIRALDYLRFVVSDEKVERDERAFILQGAGWLDALARKQTQQAFISVDVAQKEALLQHTAATPVGENWLSTLISYLLEALLTAPAYGGNPDGIGWRWLEYVPGFPLPGPRTRYPNLPQ